MPTVESLLAFTDGDEVLVRCRVVAAYAFEVMVRYEADQLTTRAWVRRRDCFPARFNDIAGWADPVC